MWFFLLRGFTSCRYFPDSVFDATLRLPDTVPQRGPFGFNGQNKRFLPGRFVLNNNKFLIIGGLRIGSREFLLPSGEDLSASEVCEF